MPLEQSASNNAFGNNVKKEIEAGKPQKQAVAIAYSVKKQNDSVTEYAMSSDSKLPSSISASQILRENDKRKRGL